MAIAAIVILGLGVALVILGVALLLVDRFRGGGAHPGVETKATGAAETMNALRRLLREIGKHPLGTQLIVWGVLVILIGAAIGGVASL